MRREFDTAEELLRQALEIAHKEYGSDHRVVATILHDLADVLYTLRSPGCLEEAQLLALQSLEMRSKLLGLDHPAVAESLNILAVTQPVSEVRDPILREALAMRRRLLRDGHPLTGLSLGNLAATLYWSGKHEEVAPLLFEAIEIYRDTFGEDHRWIGNFRGHLGISLRDAGRFVEAEPELLEAFRKSRRWSDAARLVHFYGFGFWNRPGKSAGKLGEAEAVLRQAAERKPDPFRVCWAECLTHMERYADAERELHEAFRQGLRHEVPATLVELYEAWGKPEEAATWAEQAEPEQRKQVEFARARHGDEHLKTGNHRRQLGAYLTIMGRYEEAELELVEAHRIVEAAAGEDNSWTILAVEQLVALYEAWGEAGKADKWRDRLPGDTAERDE